jgi:hypothetical protein
MLTILGTTLRGSRPEKTGKNNLTIVARTYLDGSRIEQGQSDFKKTNSGRISMIQSGAPRSASLSLGLAGM